MPKDKSKSGKKQKSDERDAARDAVDAIRSAFERTIAMTAGSAQDTRERAQGVLDEIGAAAARVRQTIEEVDLLQELRGLRGDLETLARRVSALERRDQSGDEAPAADDSPSPTAAAVKPAARRGAAKASRAAKGKRAAKGAGTGKAARGARTAAATSPGTATGPAVKGTAKSGKRASGKRAAKRPPATETADDAGSGRS